MHVAKDQYFRWKMIAARSSDVLKSTSPETRYSFFQARYGIYHALKLLGIRKGDAVLVPSYLCRAAVDPILAYDANASFYPVGPDCSTSPADLERCVTDNTRAVMIVHYFGFPTPLREIRSLCDRLGLALIEDCAHVLAGENEGQPIGTAGDAAVFSWRKFLPVYDGGELLMNRPKQQADVHWAGEDPFFTLKIAANTLEASLIHSRAFLPRLAYRGLRAGTALFRRGASSQLQKTATTRAESTSLDFDPQVANWSMTRLSRWTKDHSNVERIIPKRRRNYQMLLDAFSASKRVKPFFRNLPATVCPWIFPVTFPGLRDAHLALRDRGIPAVTWGGVRPPQLPAAGFETADFLYDNLVFLPVHQCLDDADMLSIVKVTRQISGD